MWCVRICDETVACETLVKLSVGAEGKPAHLTLLVLPAISESDNRSSHMTRSPKSSVLPIWSWILFAEQMMQDCYHQNDAISVYIQRVWPKFANKPGLSRSSGQITERQALAREDTTKNMQAVPTSFLVSDWSIEHPAVREVRDVDQIVHRYQTLASAVRLTSDRAPRKLHTC